VPPDNFSRLRGKLWTRRWINPLLERGSRVLAPTAWLQGRELVYQGIVHRELDRLGFGDTPFYPVRSAATYSYLYLLLRIAQELPPLRVLELGAGQSTVLLDRLARTLPLTCVTLESDSDWLARVRADVALDVRHAPLVPLTIRGYASSVYDPQALSADERFNVLLVDGPRASPRRSRWGALQFLERLEDDFLLVFDDAERRGELDTIGALLQVLDDRAVSYRTYLQRSINSQFLIATGRFQSALYF
jgi:predicted O-methyltransferase YrrM